MESVQWQWIWTADLNWRETASDQLLTAHIQVRISTHYETISPLKYIEEYLCVSTL
ncbi:hypothetical protein IC582_008217 [Cucumis melo]